MTNEKFNEQMLRLTEVFGAKHYTTPRLRVILNSVKHIRDEHFERTVNRLIATKRAVPLVMEILEAYEQILNEDKQRERERAPSVGMFDQLRDASKKTSADREFVNLCLSTVAGKLNGTISKEKFLEACDVIDDYADKINPNGRRRDLKKENGQWVIVRMGC